MNKLKYFFSIFLILFALFPITYFYISISKADKKTDYPGQKISQIVQKKWDDNFKNKIVLVAGNEWHGGNLSYHLKSRPKWDNILETKKISSPKNTIGGFVLIGDVDILSKICSGIFFSVLDNKGDAQGICMVGKKK